MDNNRITLENGQMTGENVLIRRVESASETQGGIIVPEASQKKRQVGEVLKVGPLAELAGLFPGDHVYFTKFAGSEVEFDGQKYLIISPADVVMRFPK